MGMRRIARSLASQMAAALAMMKDCIDRCPEGMWTESGGDRPFCRVVFHALFDCDHHLGARGEDVRDQAFHRANREAFGDYEELDERPLERDFTRDFLIRYHAHCVARTAALAERGDRGLLAPLSDVTGTMTALERAVNAVRHLQHHAAQLGLRLQLAGGGEMAWVGRDDAAPGT